MTLTALKSPGKFAAHYTEADIAACKRIEQWLKERGFKQSSLARLARISQSTLTQVLNGYYGSTVTKILATIESAMKHLDETSTDVIAPVETSIYRLAHTACTMARRYRNFAVLSAYVGVGKTFALRCYAREHSNTHMIDARPMMTSASITNALHTAVFGHKGKGNRADRFDDVVAELKNTDSLLIVDEAETLTPIQLHTLRRLRDLANIGVLLAGTEHLRGLIAPEHGQFDQIRSRTGFWPATVTQITQEDAAALVQCAFGDEEVSDEVIARLYAYSKGSARMLVEGLIAGIKEFRKDHALDVKLVDAVAKQALCLQSLA